MAGSFSSFEYSVARLPRGFMRRRRVWLFILYGGLFVGAALSASLTGNAYLLVFLLLLDAAAVLLTKRFLSLEYEFSAHDGEFEVAKIYGGVSRKLLFSSDLRRVRSLKAASAADIKSESGKHFVALTDERARDIMRAAFDTDGGETALYFNSNDTFIAAIKHYSPAARW